VSITKGIENPGGGVGLDSFSHTVIGITLAGAILSVPNVSIHSDWMYPIITSCIIGSLAPDLDCITRFKPTLFLKIHRGLTHSLLLSVFWVLLLGMIQSFYWKEVPFAILLLSTGAGYLLHIAIDAMNSYGTMTAYPFSTKRIAYYLLPIFDPMICAGHSFLAIIFLYQIGKQNMSSGYAFLGLYLLTGIYLAFRAIIRKKITNYVQEHFPSRQCLVLPTMSPMLWQIINWTEKDVRVGMMTPAKLKWYQTIELDNRHDLLVQQSLKLPEVQCLNSFTPYLGVVKKKSKNHIELKWFDYRYLGRTDYQLRAEIVYDSEYNLIHSSVGWMKM
jgi:inner membrane protein